MHTFQQKAEILRTEKFTDDIFRFTLKAPDIAAASRPGQFIMVKAGESMDPLLRRPFSVHQVAEGGLIQILFKIVGKGTLAFSKLENSDYLDVLGPMGRGFECNTNCLHYLVGGGIGIAPLLFLAKQLIMENEPATIKILLGARTGDEIDILADDFRSLGLEVITATEDGSYGKRGLVTDLITSIQNESPVALYSCGPYPMLRAVTDVCRMKSWRCQVSLETMMACGLGACLGCAVLRADLQGYVHACKDGPVFYADEVAWL